MTHSTMGLQIFVRNLNGKTMTLDVLEGSTIKDIKAMIEDKEGIGIEYQRLIFGSKELLNNDLISFSYNFCSMTLLLSLIGGGKKKKKKSYTKPKKQKHKRKKIQLAVLKYYNVDSDGSIQRMRATCEEKQCGGGVRYAVHFDRLYCGKCHLTKPVPKQTIKN